MRRRFLKDRAGQLLVLVAVIIVAEVARHCLWSQRCRFYQDSAPGSWVSGDTVRAGISSKEGEEAPSEGSGCEE